MQAVILFAALCALLVVGKAMRVGVPLLQRLYLPSSIIGGLVGLAIIAGLGPFVPAELLDPYVGAVRKVPGFLINVVFATLFLGLEAPRLKTVLRLAFPQLCVGQLLAWGQYAVGLGLSGFVFVRLFGVPAAFGNLLEIGFEGGHGTVGGMAESFDELGWSDGIALGYTMATAGMVIGIVLGMAMIQWAYRHGHVTEVVSFEDRKPHERLGIHPPDNRPSAGRQTVICDSIDSLAWHVSLTGVAILIGYGIRLLIPMKGFPLFPLCMIGGVLLSYGARLLKLDLLVDRGQMERISGAALDFLVVSAVATIQLKVVAANWRPLALLVVAGTIWSAWIVMCVAPKIFRDAWFERAIAEFGQATGVTATGLMLLRTVDPENRTSAAMSFGYKQLLHEPFMGGGIWTALAFTLVYKIGWLKVWLISVGMLVLWGVASLLVVRANRRA